MSSINLQSLSNEELLRRLPEVLKRTRRDEADLIAHIAEVDARRLYAELAWPSMFLYCVRELDLSEAEAYLRIEVARASRKYPELLTMLEDGSLHLSGLELLARQLDKLDAEKRKSVLAPAKHRTKREIQELIAELAPKPDAAPKIRKLPKKKPKESEPSSAGITELGLDPVPTAANAQTTNPSEAAGGSERADARAKAGVKTETTLGRTAVARSLQNPIHSERRAEAKARATRRTHAGC